MAYTILSRDTIRHRFDELDLIKVHICADTVEELPSADEVAKKCFVPGSTAETINDGSTYKLNHSSEWVLQPSSTVTIDSGGSGGSASPVIYGGADQNVEWADAEGASINTGNVIKLMRSIRFPEGLQTITAGTFNGCTNLEEVHFPESLEVIDGGSFCGTGLRRVVIPKGVKTVAGGSFSSCPNLREVVITDGVTGFGAGVFSGSPRLRDIVIPASLGTVPTGFASGAYFIDVTIEPGITAIDASALSYTPLETVSIPDTVTAIGNNAFTACKKLESITIPGSVTSIAEHTFDYCDNLTSITVKAVEGSIAGAPWGAPNPDVQVIWAP